MSGYIKCNKDYKNDCCCSKEKDCAVCKPLSPCPKKILLECGTTGSTMMFTATGQTFTAAHVAVDTSCFCKPHIDLMFTSQVSAVLTPIADVNQIVDAEVVLLYELVCKRNGGSEITIGSWTFRRFFSAALISTTGEVPQALETTDTFSFNTCMCASPCTGCTDYSVRVTAVTVSQDSTLTNNASATVSMGQLVAKVQNC
ncbi:DUF4489 domain-containing protein [Vallitalea pronyensis]|uniref:DUF4489 domain-containing protein n=1 Tax=Vallitalea pronyensis TaxID=1348613 RepID=A0A8J8MLQ3_9FIRM|nr:DUF4489 domain-containing protein [Vallitalea pronyensis]QUI23613.1 DUF4489 domain-containing protein [Vallitalea pronyensis]